MSNQQGYQFVQNEEGSDSSDNEDHGHSHSHGHSHGHGHHQCKHHHGGHDHGHSHNHGEGGHKGKKPKWFDKYNIQIKIFCYEYVTSGLILLLNWFNEPLKDNKFEYWAANIFVTITVIMTHWSYYVCSNGNPYVKSKKTPAWAPANNQAQCKNCDSWKPDRVHHCSACAECVMRMDHHCPWICKCVGYTNHKAFWLYVFYISLSCLIFDYRMIYWISHEYSAGLLFKHTFWFYFYLIIHAPIIFMVGLMTTGLCIYHFQLALNNSTTLESMGGANMRGCFESWSALEKKFVNKYDKGMLANLSEFFDDDPFWWWYPSTKPYQYPSFFSEKMPEPGPSEVVQFLRQGREEELTPEEKQLKPDSLADVDMNRLFGFAEHFTADKHIQFNDKMFEVGKREDHTQGQEADPNHPQMKVIQTPYGPMMVMDSEEAKKHLAHLKEVQEKSSQEASKAQEQQQAEEVKSPSEQPKKQNVNEAQDKFFDDDGDQITFNNPTISKNQSGGANNRSVSNLKERSVASSFEKVSSENSADKTEKNVDALSPSTEKIDKSEGEAEETTEQKQAEEAEKKEEEVKEEESAEKQNEEEQAPNKEEEEQAVNKEEEQVANKEEEQAVNKEEEQVVNKEEEPVVNKEEEEGDKQEEAQGEKPEVEAKPEVTEEDQEGEKKNEDNDEAQKDNEGDNQE